MNQSKFYIEWIFIFTQDYQFILSIKVYEYFFDDEAFYMRSSLKEFGMHENAARGGHSSLQELTPIVEGGINENGRAGSHGSVLCTLTL